MQTFDVVILGAGMVGLALARGLEKSALNIAVVEPHLPEPLAEQRDFALRVSAISPASELFLNQLGAWKLIEKQRLQSYQRMHVWEKDSFAKIDFDCQQAILPALGHIIENEVIRDSLWQQVSQQSNVSVINEACVKFEQGPRDAWLQFEQTGVVTAQLVVGAEGAHSWLREQLDVPLTFWDYQHHALVATIRTELPHQNCARQIFTPQGPLAFLPLSDPHLCSIVWSVEQSRAEQLQSFDTARFNQELTVAFDAQLGQCQRVSALECYPLRMRYARQFAGERFALIGDAAHTIHPLAGQGVNLGLADAKALAAILCQLSQQGEDLGEYRFLRSWERERKTQAMVMISAMEFFKQLFSGSAPAKKLLRGIGMRVTDQLPMVKQRWLAKALDLG
ncbi:FAD-dependent monooxygenase [Celerinatantimonas diazotrophica]|uniref:2-octaprenyl-3-methyl-6-methoxy-1,4-benzoquinol hydroxylase n=1 Tax=Celerinatantimonas diazotrophica TaxID=412034 RepID=A0A4R1J8S9_9GAMM|nr:FAD-dependent monooxygenase [Celerinatantimonas diazotrophica]TCK47005.1 2-octaprenyl-3-methyl-6-methoxy-1,4-benzoquinol hydroxylase [Celerinatantimonas diazotrophica]CAG9295773.1 2-octaprenylphenol hydroxylase [Celerinatantimonas diazotrophica]